jgi:hypothetical protein
VITRLSDEALELGDALSRSIQSAGGMSLVRRAAVDPSLREGMSDSLFEPIGVWELSPLDDDLELEAAAEATRVAGSFAFPYPVAERIAAEEGSDATLLVARSGRRVGNHIDLPLHWTALDLAGQRYRVDSTGTERAGVKLGPFASTLDASPLAGETAILPTALLLTLHGWWLLGLLQSALANTVRYAGEREQFGRRLRAFQGVSFQLAESSVAVRALDELAKYTVWSLRHNDSSTAMIDAIALRVASVRAAELVMHTAHQVHGAMGFTDEVDVSWLSRMSQSVRRLPEDQSRTLEVLHDLVIRDGFDGLAGAWAPTGDAEADPAALSV